MDDANILSSQTKADLDTKLAALEQKTSRALARNEGIPGGISSGAAIAGAVFRPTGSSSSERGFAPISCNCSATRKRCSWLATITGAPQRAIGRTPWEHTGLGLDDEQLDAHRADLEALALANDRVKEFTNGVTVRKRDDDPMEEAGERAEQLKAKLGELESGIRRVLRRR